eukprot:5691507-Pyramimonas_sp.AAC.1
MSHDAFGGSSAESAIRRRSRRSVILRTRSACADLEAHRLFLSELHVNLQRWIWRFKKHLFNTFFGHLVEAALFGSAHCRSFSVARIAARDRDRSLKLSCRVAVSQDTLKLSGDVPFDWLRVDSRGLRMPSGA